MRGTSTTGSSPAELAAADESDPGRAVLPRWVKRRLLAGERTHVTAQRHWAQLVGTVTGVVAGFAVVLWLGFRLPPDPPLLRDALFLAWVVLLLRAVWRLLTWRNGWFVATDKRLLLTRGVVNRRTAMMPLSKVTDMSYNQSVPGRLLGYGQFVLESAGKDQAMRRIDWVPDPDEKYRDLCEVIFGRPAAPSVAAERAPRRRGRAAGRVLVRLARRAAGR
ncbi:PH domain-containing protein [Paenibacillus sp. TRM 82003]|uniref:PH domain-containing protein n=1 Tax=Kineococcus sp. TRM81007 TaxID=2925831 RepID=UPI001F59D314|nr:PH domain-containing protein [Kineococcus sp. TRM81007]MCI2239497.1 PH domain-containing protein [Kineococcus sp. TRM81007]MCI3919298.1 PH domain-containing protein [Paenibacillus sp. TRM 82003]